MAAASVGPGMWLNGCNDETLYKACKSLKASQAPAIRRTRQVVTVDVSNGESESCIFMLQRVVKEDADCFPHTSRAVLLFSICLVGIALSAMVADWSNIAVEALAPPIATHRRCILARLVR